MVELAIIKMSMPVSSFLEVKSTQWKISTIGQK